ncbi:polar amino acid transport system substrate-binding protein [Microbacterium phyllosphaerae]|uniref:Polar amino acid transport system substrate-binding protein n=1 Tax=Microbacterium phyllosphaerae TaxID=124798 RepID=A0ABS4WND2_9MICO|nr:transporter substrate-binding domain-containing protein [Microbacterium phyllosphaerae]MBP2377714.1 polar amino acid transport system substrate-binding protein [Microbacterium phyllosphaerae]
MNSTHAFRRRSMTTVAMLGAAILLGGCAAQGTTEPPADEITMKPVADAVALLPDALQDGGTLRVAIPTNEPPTQFYREGTQEMTGINPDIARLIAGALGLDLEIDVTTFDTIIPGMSAGRYDLTVSSMTPTEERMKQLDFVDYVQMGSALAVPTGNPQDLSFDGLCGKRVAVLKGSYQLTVNVPGLDQACQDAGEKPLDILQFQDTRQAVSALLSDRADVVYADSPILGYAVSQDSKLEVGDENDFAPVAVGIPHDAGTLDAIAAALDAVIASPEYEKLLADYGLESMAVTDARVNVAQG